MCPAVGTSLGSGSVLTHAREVSLEHLGLVVSHARPDPPVWVLDLFVHAIQQDYFPFRHRQLPELIPGFLLDHMLLIELVETAVAGMPRRLLF